MGSRSDTIERLAALEHKQWAAWTRYMLEHFHSPENIARWKRQIDTPYAQLSDEEKESNREWARKVLAIVEDAITHFNADGKDQPERRYILEEAGA